VADTTESGVEPIQIRRLQIMVSENRPTAESLLVGILGVLMSLAEKQTGEFPCVTLYAEDGSPLCATGLDVFAPEIRINWIKKTSQAD
jgi:hypothetical protein